MEIKNGENRPSKDWESDDIGDFEVRSRRLGDASTVSSEHGAYQVTACRENSNQRDNFVAGGQTDRGIAGKIIRQLIEETEKQLAYHKNQVEALENRLSELNQIPDITKDSN